GFAGRGAPAAAIVADAVFLVIGIVGMAGSILVADIGIVLGALVGILDHQRDRRAGRARPVRALVLEHARENFHFVSLAALRGIFALPRLAPVEIVLDHFGCQW